MPVDLLAETQRVNVLQHGYVQLMEMMPRLVPEGRHADYIVARAARMSTGGGLKSIEEDERLIRYLYQMRHTSPFEQVVFAFQMEAPKFVFDHFVRHRTGSFNCLSARYVELPEDKFHMPSSAPCGIRSQSKVNKQCSDVGVITEEQLAAVLEAEQCIREADKAYRKMLDTGVAREVSRFGCPVGVYVTFWMKMDLHNLLHLLRLRCSEEAQYETRMYAEAIASFVKKMAPTTFGVFEETLNAVTFIEPEIELLSGKESRKLNSRETKQFRDKCDRLTIDPYIKRLAGKILTDAVDTTVTLDDDQRRELVSYLERYCNHVVDGWIVFFDNFSVTIEQN